MALRLPYLYSPDPTFDADLQQAEHDHPWVVDLVSDFCFDVQQAYITKTLPGVPLPGQPAVRVHYMHDPHTGRKAYAIHYTILERDGKQPLFFPFLLTAL